MPTEPREWNCSECGTTLTYPDTKVLEHYAEAHGDEYGDLIGQYQKGSGEWVDA